MTSRSAPLYARLLGDDWNSLPESIRHIHGHSRRLTVAGQARVERGTSLVARFVGWLFGLPQAAESVDVRVTFLRNARGETWTRRFGSDTLTTTQFEGRGRFDGLLCERFGPFVFGIALAPGGGKLRLGIRNWGVLGVPLPARLAPTGDTFESDVNGTFHFHVEVCAPMVGLVVRYTGYLIPTTGTDGE